MENDKHPAGVGGLPPTGRFSPFSPPLSPAIQQQSFSHDLSKMTENPTRNSGHRRALSEILTLPDDMNSFDSDLGVVGGGGNSFSDETEEDLFSMFLDMDKVNASSSATSGFEVEERNGGLGSGAWVKHQHSQSMDGSTSVKLEMAEEGGSSVGGKKAVSAAKLAELALVDPKRAKRIWANRQSAARSKERKMRYMAELERKVQILQTEATSLSAQLTLLQRDTNGLTAENSELKIRLQTMEQQVHLQDALNNALKDEVQHLKMLAGVAISNGGPMMNFPASYGANQPFYPNNPGTQTVLTAHQFQQLQIQSQKQQFQQQQQHQVHQFQQQHQQLHLHPDLKPSSMTMAPQKENLPFNPRTSKD